MEDDFTLRDARVGIIGLGLMGGSLAMSLKGKCARLIGFDSHPPTLQLALALGIVDHACPHPQPISHGEMGVDILILATPVPVILETINQLSLSIKHPCILLDLGSTKRDIVQAMSMLSENFDPVGGHPVCGKEMLGLENAEENLYQDAPFIITPVERTTRRSKSAAQQIISAIGANLIEMVSEEHDKVFASTSHLPFLLSSALAYSTPQEYSSFIGSGFRSASRLAGTPPHMMMGILKSNRDNVLHAIRSFRTSLDEIESALQGEDFPKLENLLHQSRSNYHSMIDRETTL